MKYKKLVEWGAALTLITGLYTGIVKPNLSRLEKQFKNAVEEIVHKDLSYIHFQLHEMLTPEQEARALDSYEKHIKEIKRKKELHIIVD